MFQNPTSRSSRIIRRIAWIIVGILISLIFIAVITFLLLQTSTVQDFGRRKIQAYLESKLHSKVIIGGLSIDFPKNIVLKNVYLEDQHRDTLLYAGNLNLNVNLWRLFKQEVVVYEVNLNHTTLNLQRTLPDSSFNYAFVARAFAPEHPETEKPVPGPSRWIFELGTVHLTDIRAHYQDDATGNDITVVLAELQTSIKTFDPGQLHFEVSEIAMHGLNGSWRQYKPLWVLQKDTGTEHSPILNLQVRKLALDSIGVAYSCELSNIKDRFDIGHLSLLANSTDVNKLQFDLQSLELNQSSVQMTSGKLNTQKTDTNSNAGSSPSWSVNIAQLSLVNDAFSLDDNSKKPIAGAVDYAHLNIRNLNTSASAFLISSENYKGEIKTLSFAEKSGFVVKALSTQFYYDNKQAGFNNLILQTDNSNLRSQSEIKYAAVASLSDRPGDIAADLRFDHSSVGVKDLLLFVPSLRTSLKANQKAKISINGRMSGQLNHLNIQNLQLAGLQQTQLEISGQITGLPDAKKAIYHVQIKNLSTSKADFMPFLSDSVLPANIRIPETFSAHGSFNGSIHQFNVNLALNSTLGEAVVQGQLDIPNKQYDLTADLTGFDLGKLLSQDSLLGTVDLHATAKGKGFDFKHMHSVAHFQIPAAIVKGYHYKDLTLDVSMQDGLYHVQSVIHDPNLQWDLDAKGKWVEQFPSLLLDLKMDTINLLALHLMKDSLAMSFNLKTDLASTDPDAMEGKIYLTALGMNYRNAYLSTDSVYVEGSRKDSMQTLLLHSEMADLNWIGRYKITELKQALQQVVNHYYQMPGFTAEQITPQNWQLNLLLKPSTFMLAYDSTLAGSDSVELKMGFNSIQNKVQVALLAPSVHFEKQFIHQLSATAETNDSAFHYNIQFGAANWAGLDLYRSGMSGWLANNQFHNTLRLNDVKNRERYRVSTLFRGMPNGWKMSLLPDSLLLNYEAWNASADNFIQYDSSGVFVNHLLIDHKNQSLLINSRSPSASSPMDVSFSHFSIKTLTSFAGQDSLLLDGEMNGQSEFRNLLSHPSFTANLKVNNLAYSRDTLGNLSVLIDNQQPNIFSNNISLEGKNNDARVSGTYDTKEKRMDMAVDLGKLDLTMIKSFSAGQVRNIRGWLRGNLHATGSLAEPVLTGNLHFDSAFLTPTFSGERLSLSTDSIQFGSTGIYFNQFSFLDSGGHEAVLDGHLYTRDYRHFRSDLSFSAKNFIVVNTPIQTNQNFYGKLNMDLGLQIKGDFDAPTLTGNLRVNKETNFTLILPNSDPEVVSRQGVVLFVDKDHPLDTAHIRTYLDSLNRNAGFRGINAIANIETDSSAQFTMIVNERTGDALSVKGRASLSGSMNRNGKLSLTGTYVLEEGDYNLSLKLIKRKFNLQKGSTITWTGDPTGATIDITATYLCNTAPISLVGSQMSGMSQQEINELNQKLPFMVNLKMQGLLLKPQISFSITLPPNQAALSQNVDSKLTELNSNPSEVNKQVFALLLFNTFISENPFENTSGGNSTAGLVASQGASSILTSQLNALAGGFAKKIDLSMNVNTDQSVNTSGQAVNQTALQLGVSKNLFGDRVKVTVGSDFQLSGSSQGPNASNIAGNVKIDYHLTPDGKYIIRVYSMNQYNTVVEGQVVETGASFIITLDFDTFNELFEKKQKTNQQP